MWGTLPELMAPLPADDDFGRLKAELEFIQRDLLAINSKLPKHFQSDEKNLKLREWADFDDGIHLLIESRKKLISKRSIWLDCFMKTALKNTKREGQNMHMNIDNIRWSKI